MKHAGNAVKAVTSALVLAACACTLAGAEPASVQVMLTPTPINAGYMARATLLPAPAGTRIDLFFTGAGPAPTSPLHVYTYVYEGSCAALPAQPALSLNEQVLVRTARGDIAFGRRGAFTLSHVAPLPLDQLMDGRYALALRSAPADGGAVLYCGELAAAHG
jgi:hypothetical protein